MLDLIPTSLAPLSFRKDLNERTVFWQELQSDKKKFFTHPPSRRILGTYRPSRYHAQCSAHPRPHQDLTRHAHPQLAHARLAYRPRAPRPTHARVPHTRSRSPDPTGLDPANLTRVDPIRPKGHTQPARPGPARPAPSDSDSHSPACMHTHAPHRAPYPQASHALPQAHPRPHPGRDPILHASRQRTLPAMRPRLITRSHTRPAGTRPVSPAL
jgi:hypothetical protein